MMLDEHATREFLLPTPATKPSGDTYIFIDYWMNLSREQEVKTRRGALYQLPSDPTQSVSQWWAEKVFVLGCASIEITHARLNKASRSQSLSVEFDWEEGTRAWEMARRVGARLGFCPRAGPRKPKKTKVE